MPAEKNKTLRVLIPGIVALLGIGVAVAMFVGSGPSKTPTTPTGQTTGQTAAQTAAQTAEQAAVQTPEQAAAQAPVTPGASTADPAAAATPAATAAPAPTPAPALAPAAALRARFFPVQSPLPLGNLDPSSGVKALISFSENGAGIAAIDLAEHFTSIKRATHVRPQEEARVVAADGTLNVLTPYAALAIQVTPSAPSPVTPGAMVATGTPQVVPLAAANGGSVWNSTAPGVFEAFIDDANNNPVLRLTRRYTIAPDGITLILQQRVQNLTPQAYTVRWYQSGPIELPLDDGTYGGDRRRLTLGYLLSLQRDPSQATVLADEFRLPRNVYLGKRVNGVIPRELPQWPNKASSENGYALSWVAMSNRFYGSAAFAVDAAIAENPNTQVPEGAAPKLAWVEQISRIVIDRGLNEEIPAVRFDSAPLTLAPSATIDLSMGIYSGPLAQKALRTQAIVAKVDLHELIIYNLGGFCGWCNFEFLTGLLLWILTHVHDLFVHDWAVSIIVLVVLVRTCLHPVTRWSQIRMARFGKQMQAIGPKQKALQEKFKDDPRKLQAETAKLWKEEGINPASLLGCFPMLLQSPVWIALFATLYFAVELRHEAAFYGVFQAIIPSGTIFSNFLADLSEPDRFIDFGRTLFTIPMIGKFDSINVLPLLLAVVFYVQQKYLTPPTAATLTPEQEMQQKMVKWMMVVMFPLFMYAQPSALALYFITNSTLGILESKWIRAHMEAKGMLDVDKMRAEAHARRAKRGASGKESFMSRMMTKVQQAQEQAQKNAGRPPVKKVKNERS